MGGYRPLYGSIVDSMVLIADCITQCGCNTAVAVTAATASPPIAAWLQIAGKNRNETVTQLHWNHILAATNFKNKSSTTKIHAATASYHN